MRSVAQVKEVTFAGSTDISSTGKGEKAEYIDPSEAW